MDKIRFKQLYQLAHGGDMVAKADLWLEFQFAYDHDPLPDFMNSAPMRTAGVSPATANPSPQTSNLNSKEVCNAHSS